MNSGGAGVVKDFAMASSASGGNEFVFDHGLFAGDEEDAACTAREFAKCAVMGGKGSGGGTGVLSAFLISREFAMRC